MPSAIPTSKPKTVFYKMVTVPKVSKSGGVAASSYSAFATAFNRMGATLNSTIVINTQIRDTLIKNLKLKSKELEDEKKQFQKERADKNKKGSSGLTKLESNVTKAVLPAIGGFFEGLMELGGFLMRAVITQSVLRWIANPANQQKLSKIWEAIVGVFDFLKTFITDNITKTLDGLAAMLDSNLGFWDRLKGFGTFIAGFGSLLLGFTFLKNPKLLLSGVKFVLQTIWKSVSQASKLLKGRRSSGGAIRGGGRAGRLLGAAAAVGTAAAIGGSMSQGESEAPHLKDGGIATRPTQAVMGERGPEVKIPLDNKKRIRDAGIKPLSTLGSGDNKPDQDKAKNLSDLYMAPFKGIGAGIIGAITSVVGQTGGPASKLSPILSDIIAPVANSFGVPSSLVKKLSGQTKTAEPQRGKTKESSLQKLYGRGKTVKTTEKKFTRKGDNTVLGLLTDLMVAGQVIANRVGGRGSNQTIQEQTSQSDPGNPNTGSKTTVTASGAAGTGRMSQVAGTKEGIGISDNDRNRQTGQLEQNHIDFKDKGKEYTILINPNNGEYKLFEKRFYGMANQEILIGGPNGPKKGGENERLLRLVHNHVQSFFVKNAQDKGLALKYLDQGMIDAFNKNQKSKANGGWISGPMSGYPVSLDGGRSTSFIGHGTEWVGFKKAAGGASDSAFVIPFDTPATKNNTGLTTSRFKQAKSGGYALPQFAKGGKVKEEKGSGDEGLRTATSGGAVITSKYGPRWGRWHAGIDLAGVPRGTPITSITGGKVLYAGSYSGYGNTVDLQVGPSKILRFAHLDGFFVKRGDTVVPGSKIGTLGNTGIGTGPHLHFEHRTKQDFGKGTSLDPLVSGALKDITIGGKPIQGAKPGSGPSTDTENQIPVETEDEMAGITGLAETFNKLNVALGLSPAPASSPSLTSATTSAEAEKDKLKSQTKAAAVAAVAGASSVAAGAIKQQNQTQTQVQTSPAKPIILPAPGPSRNLPIEALNPTTSLIQYSWKFA